MRLHEINNPRTFTPSSPTDSNPSIRGFNESKIVGKGTESSPYVIEGAESRKDVLEFFSASGLSNIIANGDWVLVVTRGAFIKTRYLTATNSLWRVQFLPTGFNPNSIAGLASSFKFEGGNPASHANWTLSGSGTSGVSGDYSFIRSGLTSGNEYSFSSDASLSDSLYLAYQVDGFHLGQELNGGTASTDRTVRIEQFESTAEKSFPLAMCNSGSARNINNLDDNLNFQRPTGEGYDTNITVWASPEDPQFIEVYQDYDTEVCYVFQNYSAYPICSYRFGPETSPSVTPAPPFRLYAKTIANTTGYNELRFLSIAGCGFHTS